MFATLDDRGVRVTLERDTAPRTVATPADLARALARNAAAKRACGALSFSHRKKYVDWITGAKRPETRAARIEKTLALPARGEKDPS